MTKNPIINAVSALIYIIIVALVMSFVGKYANGQDNIITPIAVLSILTLSAAVMGYLFISQPLMMYLDGKKKDAVMLFLQTVGTFSVITAIILIVLVSGKIL